MLWEGELLIPVEREAAPLNYCSTPQSKALSRFTASNLAAQVTQPLPNPFNLDLEPRKLSRDLMPRVRRDSRDSLACSSGESSDTHKTLLAPPDGTPIASLLGYAMEKTYTMIRNP